MINWQFNNGDDKTRITELRNFKNKNGVKYNLNSLSSGEGINYRLRIKCEGNWGRYNDSGGKGKPNRPVTRSGTSNLSKITSEPTLKDPDEIVAIYIREDSIGQPITQQGVVSIIKL